MKTLEFTEEEWQIRFLVERRFPGFTKEIWNKYWDLEETKVLRKSEIASRLSEGPLDLSELLPEIRTLT